MPHVCPVLADVGSLVVEFERGVPLISAVQLGLVDYDTALKLQQKLVAARKDGSIGDVLLFLEHSPVITLGRNAKQQNVLASDGQLATRGVELFECDRGGDVTFHGPGQLVAYPIFDLHGFPSTQGTRKTLGAIEYVRRLEEVLIRTCAEFEIPTERVPGLTGVWTRERDGKPQAKIAAIGVHISHAVTSHGFALNVNTDLACFNLIIPCGITSKPVTSMQQELGHEVDFQQVIAVTARHFAEVFATDLEFVSNLDDLGRKVGVPMRPPAELQRLHKEEESYWA
ncbi:MAG TPA: lipoyl(octanoyl) transferase LipB [Terriglobales bacterium]|nr:lipoyl(octanoyl) transferase LipB [Terriglobales bacterium]